VEDPQPRGLRRQGATFVVDPCIPSSWSEYEIDWTFGRSLYRIRVENPEHRQRGVGAATLDGHHVDALAIPLVDDGATHAVRVVMGDAVVGSRDVDRAVMSSRP